MTIPPTDTDSIYKQRVAASFSRAAATYDEYARFQEQVLMKLLTLVDAQCAGERWLDLGTGTGQGAYHLQAMSPAPELTAVDLSFSMLQQARDKLSQGDFVCADAEHLPFVDRAFAGIFSNLVIQWCPHPEVLFRELWRVSDGEVVFSTLLRGSMPELRHAWAKVDGRSHANQYASMEEVLACCEQAGFSVLCAEEQTVTTWYANVKEAVYSLKKVGASLLTSGVSVVTPKKWQAFEASYETQRASDGIPLSYQVAFIKLEKVDHG